MYPKVNAFQYQLNFIRVNRGETTDTCSYYLQVYHFPLFFLIDNLSLCIMLFKNEAHLWCLSSKYTDLNCIFWKGMIEEEKSVKWYFCLFVHIFYRSYNFIENYSGAFCFKGLQSTSAVTTTNLPWKIEEFAWSPFQNIRGIVSLS